MLINKFNGARIWGMALKQPIFYHIYCKDLKQVRLLAFQTRSKQRRLKKNAI